MVKRWLSAVVTGLGWKESVSLAAPDPRGPDPIEIDLSDLAKGLWLPLNIDFMRIEVPPEENRTDEHAMVAESDSAQRADPHGSEDFALSMCLRINPDL